MALTLQNKIREIFQECLLDIFGETSEIYGSNLQERVLEELGKVAQHIREKLRGIQQLKTYGNYETRKEEMLLQWILGLLVEDKKEKPRTVCLSCGYDGDEIQGDHADLYEGYGCPKCHSPLVVDIEDSKVEGEK